MARGKGFTSKARDHQWRRNEPIDELWFSRLGQRPHESLYNEADPLLPPSSHPWGRLPVLPVAALGGNALLESRVHALVGAMAAFTSAPFGLTTRPAWNGPAFVPVGVANHGAYPSMLP